MSGKDKYLYQFGPFSLYPNERTLIRNGIHLALRPKAFDVLLYLVENNKRLIGIDELMDAVWHGNAVEQSYVTVMIHELRKILDKDAPALEHVWKGGYRLIVDVKIIMVTDSVLLNNEAPKEDLQPSRSLRVFLCHASNDKPAVRKLYHRLRIEGIDPWLDEENLLPGQEWEQEIPEAVRTNDLVIVCLSNAAITKSGYVQREIRYALDIADEQPDGTIFLIPLKLEQCEIPARLRRWQWVNFFEEHGYEMLMRALRVRANDLGAVIKSRTPQFLSRA